MAKTMNLSVKWMHENQFRRFSVDIGDKDNAFELLTGKVRTLVPDFKKPLAWKDSDGDMIVLASDSEVREAVRESQDMLLRLFTIEEAPSTQKDVQMAESVPMTPLTQAKETPKDKETEKTTGRVVHQNVFCDGCDMRDIEGVRFKCMVCPDFDLCSTCEHAGKHKEHPMIRIADPEDKSWAPVLWRYRHGQRHGGPAYGHRGFHRRPWGCRPGSKSPPGSGDEGHMPPPPHHRHRGHGPHGPRRGHRDHHEEGALRAYLMSVGKTVGDALKDFGIDVDVDVDHGNGNVEKATAPDNTKAKDSAPATEAPKDKPKEPTAPQANQADDDEVMEVANDWTILNNQGSRDSTPVLAPASAPAAQETATGPVRMIPINQVAAPTAPLYPIVPQASTDPLIESTISSLLGMGIKDDQGWLRALVEAKKGDINEVLNALNPFQSR